MVYFYVMGIEAFQSESFVALVEAHYGVLVASQEFGDRLIRGATVCQFADTWYQ